MLEHFTYLTLLLIAIAGLVACDWRWRLAFFYDVRRASLVIAIGLGLFLIWDALGVMLGIFFPGNSPYALGLGIIPGFRIEEVLFLVVLCYTALVIWRGSEEAGWRRTSP